MDKGFGGIKVQENKATRQWVKGVNLGLRKTSVGSCSGSVGADFKVGADRRMKERNIGLSVLNPKYHSIVVLDENETPNF